jgi:O-antigen ligase
VRGEVRGDRVPAALARVRAGIAAAALAVLGLVALALPFVTGSPTAFNNRGGFWQEGIDAWLERPLLGWGADYYLQLARSADNLGGFAYHAHNQTAQLLVTGGLVLLVLVLAAVVWASVVAVRHAAAGTAWPAAFLAAFLVSAMFEVPLGLVDRGMFYPAVLVPLCLLLSRSRDPHPALTDREAPSPA